MSVNWGMAGAVRPDPYGAYLDARDRREERGARLEEQQQQRTTRSANEAWARALAADDLAAARDIAAKAGSPEAVQSVNEQVQRRVRQEAIRFNTELADIARLPDGDPQRAARYAQLYQSTLSRASHWGLDRISPEAIQQFRQMYPQPGQENAAALQQVLQTSTRMIDGMFQQDMTGEQWASARQRGEVRAFGSGGLYRNDPNAPDGVQIIREPQRGGAAGGAYVRPLSPEEAAQYGIEDPEGWTINERTGQPAPLRRQQFYPDTAAAAGNYAHRMAGAQRTMREIEARHANDPAFWAGIQNTIVGTINSGDDDTRAYRQAAREFINSALRKESGAVISQEEFASAGLQYIPTPADAGGRGVSFGNHADARQRTFDGMRNQSQGYYDEFYSADDAAPNDGGGADARPALPPPAQRVVGRVYPMPDGGTGRWMGDHFEPVTRPGGR